MTSHNVNIAPEVNQTMTTYAWLIVLILSSVALAAPAIKVKDKVEDLYIPAAFEDQKLTGYLAERIAINQNKRLLRVDEPGVLGGFQKRPGSHPWIGEHVGKFLHAACNAYRYSGDKQLKDKIDRVARELMKCQLDDGYLGTYTDDQRWTEWDVWVHKYNLIGLLSYYDLSGDEKALQVCRGMGDLLWRTFGDGQSGANEGKDLSLHGTHVGMASCSVLEPIVNLYRRTGEKRYLDFAFYITRSIEQHSKVISNLTETKRAFGTANNKAYEMLSVLVGLVELYRVTGDETYLKPALYAWEDIVDKRLYVTGTGSAHERWQEDHHLPAGDGDDIGEGCVTTTWIQLNLSLLRLSGEAKYADQLEKTIYNHLIGAQNTENGDICYYMALVGTKRPTPGINCCVSSIPRGISLIPPAIWGRRKDGIAINIYESGTAKIPLASGEVVEVTCKTELPREGGFELTITSDKAGMVPVYLRKPSWVSNFEVGNATREGGYHRIEWDTAKQPTMKVSFVPTLKTLAGDPTYRGYIGVQYGPQVLCFDSAKAKDVELPALMTYADGKPQFKDTGHPYYIREAKGVTVTIDRETRQFRRKEITFQLVPFADAAAPRVWLPPFDSLPTGVAPVTFAGKMWQSRGGKSQAEGPYNDLRNDTFKSTRAGGNADEDWFAIAPPEPVKISRIVYRHGSSRPVGGWFDTSAGAGKPRIEYKTGAGEAWKPLGVLEDYPATTSEECNPPIPNGQAFELKLSEPIEVFAIRVIGKPSGGRRTDANFATCAELHAYEQ